MTITSAVIQGVLSSGQETSPPLLLTNICSYFSLGRRCWRALRMGSVYSKPDNWLGLTLGVGLELYAGNMTIVCIGALVAVVVARVLDSMQYCRRAKVSMKNLLQAGKGHRVMPLPCVWRKGVKKGAWLSPSTELWWCSFSRYQNIYWRKVGVASYDLIKIGLLLTNTLAELADALTWEPETNRRNVREVFINLDSIVDSLVAEAPFMVEQLREHHSIVKLVLDTLKVPWSAGDFIDTVDATVRSMTAATGCLASLKRGYGEEIKGIAKKGLTGVMAAAGCLEHMPQSLLSADKQDVQSSESDGCTLPYPSMHLISRPSTLPKPTDKPADKKNEGHPDQKNSSFDLFYKGKALAKSAVTWSKKPAKLSVKKSICKLVESFIH